MINELIKALEELGYPVAYGMVTQKNINDNDPWNYFVVMRSGIISGNNGKYYEFNISFVHEDYIPEKFEDKIIEKVKQVKHMRLKSDANISFGYSRKGKSNTSVEVMTIPFKGMLEKCRI